FKFASWREIRQLRIGLGVFVMGLLTSTLLMIGYTFVCLNGMQLIQSSRRGVFILASRAWSEWTSFARIVCVVGMVLTIMAGALDRRARIRAISFCMTCALPYVIVEIAVILLGMPVGRGALSRHPIVATSIGAANAIFFVGLVVAFWVTLAGCVDR